MIVAWRMIGSLGGKHRCSLNHLRLVLWLVMVLLLLLRKNWCLLSRHITCTTHHCDVFIMTSLSHLWHVEVTVRLWSICCSNIIWWLLLRCRTTYSGVTWNCVLWMAAAKHVRTCLWRSSGHISLQRFIQDLNEINLLFLDIFFVCIPNKVYVLSLSFLFIITTSGICWWSSSVISCSVVKWLFLLKFIETMTIVIRS